MKDIEVKRKELETAKRIREMGSDGHCAICDGVLCDEDNCPFVVLCTNSRGSEVTPDFVKGFISAREAELAALEKTPRLYIGKDGNPEYIMPIGPTLDDFALALIQGGFYQELEADEETHVMPAECLFNAAAALKAESDRRRASLQQEKTIAAV